MPYPALERVAVLTVHSIVGHHIPVGIVHVSPIAAVVPIGHCTGQLRILLQILKNAVNIPEQSMMFCSLRVVSLPLARAQAPSRAPIALKA